MSDLSSLNEFILESLFISLVFVKCCSLASPPRQIDDSSITQQTTWKDFTKEASLPKQRLLTLQLETTALPLLVLL